MRPLPVPLSYRSPRCPGDEHSTKSLHTSQVSKEAREETLDSASSLQAQRRRAGVLIELIQLRRQPSPKSKLSLPSLVSGILSLLGVRFLGQLFPAGTPNTLVREARRL